MSENERDNIVDQIRQGLEHFRLYCLRALDVVVDHAGLVTLRGDVPTFHAKQMAISAVTNLGRADLELIDQITVAY